MIKTIKDLVKELNELDENLLLNKPIKKIRISMYHISSDGYNWGYCFGYDEGSKKYGCCESMRQRRMDDNPVPTVIFE